MKNISFPLIIVIFLLASCSPSPTPGSLSSSSISTKPTQTSKPSPAENVLSCNNTKNYVGDYVTCMMSRAYCSYQPAVNGNPTFCNDAPYPNHDFTLVIWERDMSSLDNQCIIISGYVSLYKSKPQIEAESSTQISYCP